MRRYSFLFLCISFLATTALILSGCATTDSGGIQIEPELHQVDKKDMKYGEIKLPLNYSDKNYRRLVMVVSFQAQGKNPGEISQDVIQIVSARMQTEMAKLKRFTIFSVHNRGGVRIVESLSEIGEAKTIEEKDMPTIDLVLTGAITMSKEKYERSNRHELIYEVESDFNCEDYKTKTVKFAEKSKGRAKRTQFYSLSGAKMGGYDEAEEKQALYEASFKALTVLANKLGNTYPVGGKITGILGDRMKMDKGFDHGIGQGMQMVVYSTGVVDLPIAIAEAQPGPETATLKVWKWNKSDKYARRVIAKIQKDPGVWLQNNSLFACSAGMAVPPEWEKAYKD